MPDTTNEPHGNKNAEIGVPQGGHPSPRDEEYDRLYANSCKIWKEIWQMEERDGRATSDKPEIEYRNYAAAAKSIGLTPIPRRRLEKLSIAATNTLMDAMTNAATLMDTAFPLLDDAMKAGTHAGQVASAILTEDFNFYPPGHARRARALALWRRGALHQWEY